MIETLEITQALTRELNLLSDTAKDPSQRHILFWQSPQSLVVPRSLSTKPGFAAACDALRARGWPVCIRATGGDVTPQGKGVLNVSLIYAPDGAPDVERTYLRLCKPMEEALGQTASHGWNPGAFCDGAYNVQLDGLKFAGTAQRFKKCAGNTSRSAVLSHALMLMEPPGEEAIDAINQLLSLMDQPRQIDIAQHTGLPEGTSVEAFVTRLNAAYEAILQ